MGAEARFRALGSDVHVVVLGDVALPDVARARLEELEALWSRFRPDSELCALNAAAGGPAVRVSVETVAVVKAAVDSWRVTGGLFDPTVLPALTAAGYDRSFDVLPAATPEAPGAAEVPGCSGVEVDLDRCTVRLPAGVALDLGGIGKGFAADIVARELVASGAGGACVNLGGDLRCLGQPPASHGWTVGVAAENSDEEGDLAGLALREGAVATSTVRRRTWMRADQRCHHVIDPRTGVPGDSDLVAVTVLAAEARWAEAFTKAALLAGADGARSLLTEHGLTGVLQGADGTVQTCGDVEDYLLWMSRSGGTSPARAG